MALPPTPSGYDNWNDYIETNAPALAAAQGLTLQQAKASLKLLYVSEPIRSDVNEPYFREYNVFTTWADRAQLPSLGRPWLLANSIVQIETFTTVGSTTWTVPYGTTSVEYLVVGGGGGAGNGYDNAGGGGGGAGMVLSGIISVVPDQIFTIVVGAGGAGGADTRTNNAGLPGNNSSFGSIIALGGGRGLGSRTGGTPGAAQIGTTTAPTGGSGSGGGNGGKGGGGAGGAGSANSGATGGAGGQGVTSAITGSTLTYGVGGAGGGAGTPTTDGADGAANTGNGGQGGKSGSTDSAKGGDGGSGIVIISYNTFA